MSDARRQAQLLKDKFLDSLGSEKLSGEFELNNIESVLYDWAADLEQQAIDILNRKGRISTGELESSFKTIVKFDGSKYTLTISLADYWDYVNSGVKGVSNMNAPASSPYSFKNKYPSKKMVISILKWLRTNVNAVRFESAKIKGRTQSKRRRLSKIVKKAPSLKAVAYGMATNIKKYGLKASGFIDTPLKRLRPELNKKLAIALREDFRLEIRKINYELNNS